MENMWDRPTNEPFPAERMAFILEMNIRMQDFHKPPEWFVDPAALVGANQAAAAAMKMADVADLPELLVFSEAERARRRFLRQCGLQS